MKVPWIILPLCVVAVESQVHAQSTVWQLPDDQSPHSLAMRASAWKVHTAVSESSKVPPDEDGQESLFSLPTGSLDLEGGSLERLPRQQLHQDVFGPSPLLSDRITFRFNLGMGLDGGQPSEEPTLAGRQIDERFDYERLRLYTFGDAVFGSRGLGLQGLNTYVAGHFRRNQRLNKSSTAIPTVYNGNTQQPLIRSAYGEFTSLSKTGAPMRVRAGRMYKYGIGVVHFDGVVFGYEGTTVQISAYTGRHISQYSFPTEVYQPVSGLDLKLDLYHWRRWPVVLLGHFLDFNGVRHVQSGATFRWNRNILLRGNVRTLSGLLVHSQLQMRARISEVTSVNAQLSNHSSDHWSYGLLMHRRPDSAAEPRQYLDLGPQLPRTLVSLRYGTVFMRNLDVLLRAGAAVDRRGGAQDVPTQAYSSFVEGGSAVEIQMRRTLRVGIALSNRRYFHGVDKVPDTEMPSALPFLLNSSGLTSFWEGGVNFLYVAGPRQFRASAEFYGRRYSYRSAYEIDKQVDFRSGGRFSIEGWIADRLRIRTEYDVTFSRLLAAPELRGFKTLRIMLEGSF